MKSSDLITKHDLDEFKQELLEAIKQIIETVISEAQMQKKWLRTNELAEYLSLSNSQISVLKQEGIIKCRKLGDTNFFNKNEIDDYLKNQVNGT
jgi:predicted DNA-binding transcriptional regulator AlpA